MPTILLVDDDIDLLRALTRLLVRVCGTMSEDVVTATNVDDALAVIRENFDSLQVVTLDGSLSDPGDTIPIAMELKSRGFQGTLLAMSADSASNMRLLEAGCVAAIDKQSPHLATILQAFLSK